MDKNTILIHCFAFILGDGHLEKNLNAVQLAGNKEDLLLLKSRIENELGLECRISGPNKNTYRLHINNKSFSTLLYEMGAPKGDKVNQKFLIPECIMNADKEIKRNFLSVLFGNELGTPNLQEPYKNTFESIGFTMQKVNGLSSNAMSYLEQIRNLLKEFDIESSPIKKIENTTLRKKDGLYSSIFRFYIRGNSANVLKLYKEIQFSYANKKQKAFNKIIKEFEVSVTKSDKYRLYQEVMKLNKSGMGSHRISNKLEIRHNLVSSWVYKKQKPHCLKYYDLLEQIIKDSDKTRLLVK